MAIIPVLPEPSAKITYPRDPRDIQMELLRSEIKFILAELQSLRFELDALRTSIPNV